MVGEREIDVDQLFDLAGAGGANRESVRKRDLRQVLQLPHAVRVLLAETEAGPGIEELAVPGGNENRVAITTFVHPPPGHDAVEVAYVLRVLRGVPGRFDP